MMARASRSGKRGAVMLIDLDHFKHINDTLGHAAGDDLLITTAARLSQTVRLDDTVARLGGDEFAIILNELGDPQDAALLAHKIIGALAAPCMLAGADVVNSASIGIALFPDDAATPEHLLLAADAAMYRAKSEGRNGFAFYTQDIAQRTEQRLAIEAGLRSALGDGQLALYFQPQFALACGRIVGLEALLRWRHPVQGLTMPAQFIGVAEQAGLLGEINAWVIDAALHQAKLWTADGIGPLRLAINLAGSDKLCQHTVKQISAALDQHAPGPNDVCLQLEITDAISQGFQRFASTVQNLQQHGLSLAIDSFGTDHASLTRLKELGISVVKIKRDFIADIGVTPDGLALTAALIALAHGLKLEVIAEGVETSDQLASLCALGCDTAQGFLLAPPAPASCLNALLLAHGDQLANANRLAGALADVGAAPGSSE